MLLEEEKINIAMATTYRDLSLFQVKSWLRLLEVQIRWDLLLLKNQYRLDEASQAARSLCMAQVGFDRTNIKVPVSSVLREDVADGLDLSSISRHRASAVSFNIESVSRVQAGGVVNVSNESLLGVWTGKRYAVRLPVLIRSTVADHSMDVVTILNGVGKTLDDDGGDSFSSPVPGSSAIKREAFPLRVQHPARSQSGIRE